MASALKNSTGSTTLSYKIMDASPEIDAIKLENRLLDGTFHFEIVGSTAKLINVELIATAANVSVINGYESMATDVRLEYDEKYYLGPIRSKPRWSLFSHNGMSTTRLYRGEFQMVATAEGTA